MNDTKHNPIQTAIWTTAHCRMIAERRYRRYDTLSHIQLSWLSLTGITWAVARTSMQHTAFLDTYTTILTVLVFAFSIIIFGFRFGETAASHRECYLHLQKLLDSTLDERELTKEYHEILGAYPNHADRDYDSLIIEKTLIRNRGLWDKAGNPISWKLPIVFTHILRTLTFWAANIFFFTLGTLPYYFIFHGLA